MMKRILVFLASLSLLSVTSYAQEDVQQVADRLCPTTTILYYSPTCPHSQRVIAYLDQKGIRIPQKDVSKDAVAKEELRTKGGLMQVPCLLIDGKPLYDDEAILKWLNDNLKCFDLSLR